MKSTEIRKAQQEFLAEGKLPGTNGLVTGPNAGQTFFLAELAAQVAELNENWQEFKVLFASGGAIDVNVRKVE